MPWPSASSACRSTPTPSARYCIWCHQRLYKALSRSRPGGRTADPRKRSPPPPHALPSGAAVASPSAGDAAAGASPGQGWSAAASRRDAQRGGAPLTGRGGRYARRRGQARDTIAVAQPSGGATAPQAGWPGGATAARRPQPQRRPWRAGRVVGGRRAGVQLFPRGKPEKHRPQPCRPRAGDPCRTTSRTPTGASRGRSGTPAWPSSSGPCRPAVR